MTIPTLDLAAIKRRQQAAWSAGDYAAIGARVVLAAELLCEAIDLRSGQRVLDVACGTGNAALAAARRFCTVTGVDYVPALLDRARRRAAAEGLEIAFQEGDAEDLPLPAASFDVVLSTCGAMFAPDQECTARELLRVCRPGGRIGMVNWTSDSYSAALFTALAAYKPPPTGLRPPTRWGDPDGLRELFGPDVRIDAPRRSLLLRFPSPEYQAQFFATHFGPIVAALEALDPDGRRALAADLVALARRYDASSDATLVLRLDYLEVIATAPA